MLTGKGQVAAPAASGAANKPVAVSKPAAQPTQQVVTNRMPASEPYRVGEGGAPVSSVGSASGAGVIKPHKVAAQEPSAPVASVQSNDKSNSDPPRGHPWSESLRLAEKHGVRSQARLGGDQQA